jgi:hypothetical protein
MKLFRVVPLLLLLGCNPLSNFSNDESSGDSNPDDDDKSASDTVDEPSMVGGAYLTCSLLDDTESAPAEGDSSVGCRIEDPSGGKVPLSSDIKATVTAYDGFNAPMEDISIEESTNTDDEWNWTLGIVTEKIPDATIQVHLLHVPTGIARTLTTSILNTGNLNRMKIMDYRLSNLHVGDWNVNAIPTEILTTTCAGIVTGAISESAGRIEIPFKATSAEFGISIKSCDAQRLNSNKIEILDSTNTVVKSEFFVDGKNEYLFANEGWGTGSFKLVVSGKNAPLDTNYDNFIITEVSIKSSAGIELADRVVKQPSPLVTLDGLPIGTSTATTLNIRVLAQDPTRKITHYKYKVNEAQDFKCEVKEDYSALRPVSELITDSIAKLSDGTIEICVIGVDETVDQNTVVEQYFSAKWEKK